ncbi:hypothetical protein C2G38_2044120 [Gigaspora rosea]|uniref:DNA 3'-5' helicase n=1 Tax=Gigaspora rosea TaxID=44941 RepID=A0A397UHJ9_9GLOM|nr:hypothetical protein C2G38_2044120 [Gigaspora rosea]
MDFERNRYSFRVIQYYPNLFNSYNQTIKAFQKETRLENAMKRVAHELNNKIDENELPIINGILLEHQVDTIGFSVKCQIICHLCGGIIENDNEPKNIHFTKAFSVAALVGEIYIQNLKLDISYKPVIAFHTIEKAHSIKDQDTGKTINLYEENFEKSSRQMEHCILIAILNEIEPYLNKYDFVLEIVVDRDLDTNRILANMQIVSRIYADLKYISKNVRKSLLHSTYRKFHNFEQYIMRYFNGCVYTAELRKENSNEITPTQTQLQDVQIDGLIHHLQDDHSLCWPEVCWIKDNPELCIQDPTLKHYSQVQIKEFRQMLEKIFKLPVGQGLVTIYRTSINEAFNRVKLVYLDKKIDFWKSFNGRHALAIIYHNDGYAKVLETIRYGYTSESFTIQDKINIEKIENIRKDQQVRNVKNIYLCNTERANIYLNEKNKLQGFNFAQLNYCYQSLTALMENQVTCLTNLGVPSAALYTSTMETATHEEKIFEEIAIGFLKVLYTTSEKIKLNKRFQMFLDKLYQEKKLQLVIDEVHCVLSYQHFRESWGKLGFLKQRYPTVPLLLLTATASSTHIEAICETLNIE